MVATSKVGDKDVSSSTEEQRSSRMQINLPVNKVVVHPLVLLSVVDHYYRVSKTENVRRVVGVLLGSQREDKVIDVSNSFAVPFDETDANVWFLDNDYLENMYGMFRKVNAREKIVGWYHSGPNLNPNDININDVLKQHAPDSVLLVVDVQLAKSGRLPTDAYIEVEEVHSDGTPPTKTFEHVASEIGAEEAEEVGVEHLLRDIKDQTAGTLSQKITDKYLAVQNMHKNLALIANYLKKVSNGDLPPNHQLNYLLQDLLNLLPDILSPDFVKSTNVMLNDEMLQIYLATLARSVVSLHNLINNKISLREAEKLENDKTKDATTKREELTVGADKKKNEDSSKEPLNPAKKN